MRVMVSDAFYNIIFSLNRAFQRAAQCGKKARSGQAKKISLWSPKGVKGRKQSDPCQEKDLCQSKNAFGSGQETAYALMRASCECARVRVILVRGGDMDAERMGVFGTTLSPSNRIHLFAYQREGEARK